MRIEVKEQDLSLLYDKAKTSYRACINRAENEFLKDEVNMPLEDLLIKEKDIKIVFYQNIAREYLLEVSLILHAANKEIGKYTYFEDEKGNGVDDSLVFY